MSVLDKVAQLNSTRLNGSTLNPNATEFIPFCPPAREVPVLSPHRAKSSASNDSDEEARLFWSCQLPDDIIPDFNDEEINAIESISLQTLSLDEMESSARSKFLVNQDYEGSCLTTSLRNPVSSSGARLSSLNVNAKPWEAPNSKDNILLDKRSKKLHPYGVKVGDFVDDIVSESGMVDSSEVDSIAFLANQFPGFSYESLAEVFFANQHDLNSTVDMLTQLEHQVEGGFDTVANSKPSSALNPNAPVFHSRAMHEARKNIHISSRDGFLHSTDPYQPPDKDRRLLFSSTSSKSAQNSVYLDSSMGISSLQKTNPWKYEGNMSIDMGIGSSKRSDLIAPSVTRVSSLLAKIPSPNSANITSLWHGYVQPDAIVHPELREDISQHGGLLNTYLQQGRPSYSTVNKSPEKMLEFEVPSLYNMIVKPARLESMSITRPEEKMIDVHDLHVTDAIHVLSHELNTVRSAARASEQSLPVCICVGSEHHARGTFTPAKLPVAVRRYLVEEEHLNYSELQPGLLRVVIC